MNKKRKNIIWLCEGAIMIALATVLSMFKAVDLPYGGSVTVCSMLPIMLVAYRYGLVRGIVTGAVYGGTQLILGMNALSYATSWQAAVAIVVLDFILAFAALGLVSIFGSKSYQKQSISFFGGVLIACAVRYIFHVVAGCTVWAGVSVPSGDGLIYSLIYNATYMLPETIVTVIGGFYLTKTLDFTADRLGPRNTASTEQPKAVRVFMTAALFILAGVLIYDTAAIFGRLQNADSGEFDITGISAVPWLTIGILTAAAVALVAVAALIKNRKKQSPTI